jgi:predicted HTH domain antitoxin
MDSQPWFRILPRISSILKKESAVPSTLRLEWELPEGALEEPFRTDLVQAVRREVALRLFADGKISSGYGARMLGISRWEFIQLLGERQIPIISYEEGELEQEIATLDRLLKHDKPASPDQQ